MLDPKSMATRPANVDADLVFPSDLAGISRQLGLGHRIAQLCEKRGLSPQGIKLAGRVVLVSPTAGTLSITLADACCSVSVVNVHPMSKTPKTGDLLTIEVSCDGAARICDRHLGSLRAQGEFALAMSSRGRYLAARASTKRAVRAYLDALSFTEVETPVRVKSPGTDLYVEPIAAAEGWLVTSPEFQMKRLIAGGMSRIYQFATCTRAEELGPWHEPEFTLLEWYRAFSGMTSVLRDTENIVRLVANHLEVATTSPLHRPPYARLSVRDAFREYAGVSDAVALADRDEDKYFQLLVDKVEPGLTRRDEPVFLERFPVRHAALARVHADDPTVAERFELYTQGVELCNGYGELTDPAVQRRRFEQDRSSRGQRGLRDLPIDEKLLAAMTEGLPPCGGNAIGFDRLIAVCLGVHVPDVKAFPAHRL